MHEGTEERTKHERNTNETRKVLFHFYKQTQQMNTRNERATNEHASKKRTDERMR